MSNLRSLCSSYLYALLLASFILMSVAPTTAFAGPVVQILKPQQGQIVSGEIWMDIAYSSNTDAAITRLEIYIDNELVRKENLAAPEKSGEKSFSWDFSFAAATSHAISAKAIDSAGASGSATISVTVRRAVTETTQPGTGGTDVIPPTINIYYPAQGAKLSDWVEIRAEARDNVRVEQVYFYIDGRLHKMIYNSAPYYDQWDTSKTTDGIHVLEAVAVDAADNEARSAQITVFVENHAMTRMETAETASQPARPMTTTQPPITPTPAVVPAPVVVRQQTPPAVVQPPVTPSPTAPPAVVVLPSGPPVPTPPPASAKSPVVGQEVSTSVAGVTGPPEAVEKPALTATSALPVTGRQSPIEFDLSTSADYTSAPRLGYPGKVVRVPESPVAPGIAITEFGRSKPVEIGRASPRQSGLAVVRRTSPSATAPESSSNVGRLPTLATDPVVPTRQIAIAGGAKVVPPSPTLIVERPGIAPLVGSVEYGRIAALSVKTAEPGALFAIFSGTPRATPPSATSSHPAPSDVKAAGQQASVPQVVKPLSSTAPSVASLDKTIPTFRAVSTIMPGDGVIAASLWARTTGPAKVETAVVKPSPASSSRGSLAMLPKGELPSSPAGTTTPGIPDLAAVKSRVKDIAIIFDGDALEVRTAPETVSGIATGPLRELFEHTDGVLYWFPITKEVRAISATADMHLTIGDPNIDVNGTKRHVELAPYVKRGRTMLPLQFIADTLDLTITYNPATQQIVVTSNDF